jgi:hypothetical protein
VLLNTTNLPLYCSQIKTLHYLILLLTLWGPEFFLNISTTCM